MNTINSGSLEDLKAGDTLLVNARQVNGGKLHLEFAEIIQINAKPMNALTLLNKSDERFSSSARRSWLTAEPADATEVLGINLGSDAAWEVTEKGEMLELNILNPAYNNVRFRVVVDETTTASEWQEENIETAAKRKGKDGDYITHEGKYIFSNTDVVMTNEETKELHTFLQPDSITIEAEGKASVTTSKLDAVGETNMIL